MANVKTTLTVEAGATKNSFTNNKNYTEETVTKYYVNNADGFTDLIQFSPDDDSPTKTGISTGALPKRRVLPPRISLVVGCLFILKAFVLADVMGIENATLLLPLFLETVISCTVTAMLLKWLVTTVLAGAYADKVTVKSILEYMTFCNKSDLEPVEELISKLPSKNLTSLYVSCLVPSPAHK